MPKHTVLYSSSKHINGSINIFRYNVLRYTMPIILTISQCLMSLVALIKCHITLFALNAKLYVHKVPLKLNTLTLKALGIDAEVTIHLEFCT